MQIYEAVVTMLHKIVVGSESLLPAGENEHVAQAVGRPSVNGRGVRILSMDGGGMKVRLQHLLACMIVGGIASDAFVHASIFRLILQR